MANIASPQAVSDAVAGITLPWETPAPKKDALPMDETVTDKDADSGTSGNATEKVEGGTSDANPQPDPFPSTAPMPSPTQPESNAPQLRENELPEDLVR
ncbi:hypothetical protein [Eubacterium barkeri]|uniref:hypothetical protein n=1 Tax=Eubacterium barkeri TaxID=1528 RepID=UPI00115FC994|nr:hypothetical protein [Eubacterium barkeri]